MRGFCDPARGRARRVVRRQRGGRVKVVCLSCSVLEPLPKNAKHAAVGLGVCPGGKPGQFINIGVPRACGKYRAAPTDIAAARITWFKKLDL